MRTSCFQYAATSYSHIAAVWIATNETIIAGHFVASSSGKCPFPPLPHSANEREYLSLSSGSVNSPRYSSHYSVTGVTTGCQTRRKWFEFPMLGLAFFVKPRLSKWCSEPARYPDEESMSSTRYTVSSFLYLYQSMVITVVRFVSREYSQRILSLILCSETLVGTFVNERSHCHDDFPRGRNSKSFFFMWIAFSSRWQPSSNLRLVTWLYKLSSHPMRRHFQRDRIAFVILQAFPEKYACRCSYSLGETFEQELFIERRPCSFGHIGSYTLFFTIFVIFCAAAMLTWRIMLLSFAIFPSVVVNVGPLGLKHVRRIPRLVQAALSTPW